MNYLSITGVFNVENESYCKRIKSSRKNIVFLFCMEGGREVKEPSPPRFVTYCCAPLIFWYIKLRVDPHFFFSCFLNPLWIINSRIFCAPNQQRLKSLRILEGGREFGIKHCEVYIWIRRLEIGKVYSIFPTDFNTNDPLTLSNMYIK